MNTISKKMRRGFTLVELMVVIAIIALLTGIVIANLSTSRSRARDAKRISDMGQIQLALELYFDRCNEYPESQDEMVNATYQCPANSSVTIGTFMSQIPTPPPQGDTNWDTGYKYYTNGDRTDYVLQTRLEAYSETLKDSLQGDRSPISTFCDVASDNQYCIGPK